ncbi:hypothetical protein ACFYZT_32150 [Streptomyces sp. NPDC001591]|uniref:hypothetical protein n=1 Tax=Streptomyces sp. NPDC001591 TaxID=3364589 RepID=UPI00369744C5
MLVEAISSEADQDLSPSCYDIAVVALVGGPQQRECVEWLRSHRHASGLWGAPETLCWNDTYISTYAASVALRASGHQDEADAAHTALKTIDTSLPVSETMTFGGFVDFLDRLSRDRSWPVPEHPQTVHRLIVEERAKWNRMKAWPEFYNPELSIAGFCAERAYGDDDIDLARLVDTFQTDNGAISHSPGASAGVLLEHERRGTRTRTGTGTGTGTGTDKLAGLLRYVRTRRPETLGYLDHLPHFVTAWSAMFAAEVGPIPPGLAHATAAMLAEYDGGLASPIGPSTVPGDPDTTACVLLAAHAAGLPLPEHPGLEQLYDPDKGCYRTFMFERDGSLSTNIHMAGLLHLTGRHRRRDEVLEWLHHQLLDLGVQNCKWHISPTYTLGEAARVLAPIDTPTSRNIRERAVARLLELQSDDGGWGTEQSTVEETAYAALGLAAAPETSSGPALPRAQEYLARTTPGLEPLWIGKTFYCLRPLVPVLHQVALTRIQQVTAGPSRSSAGR